MLYVSLFKDFDLVTVFTGGAFLLMFFQMIRVLTECVLGVLYFRPVV
jgi:hypothetical protein